MIVECTCGRLGVLMSGKGRYYCEHEGSRCCVGPAEHAIVLEELSAFRLRPCLEILKKGVAEEGG